MERYRQMRNRVKQKEENVQNTKLYSEKKKNADHLKENDVEFICVYLYIDIRLNGHDFISDANWKRFWRHKRQIQV